MATYYIAPSTHPTTPGNDTTGNGSSGTPWATISKAHTSAASGDTIICKDGTYTWVDQTFTKDLTIQAENARLAIFDGGGVDVNWNITAGVTFQNLIFEDVIQTAYLFRFNATSTITFAGCVFRNLQTYMSGNTVNGYTDGAFEFPNSSVTISVILQSCIFDDCRGVSSNYILFTVYGPASINVTLTVLSCVFYFSTSTNRYAYLTGTRDAGVAGAFTLTMRNTIISNATGGAMTYNRGLNLASATYNNNTAYNITSPPSGSNNLTSDPEFIDAAGGNFSLQTTSPCIATGDPSA